MLAVAKGQSVQDIVVEKLIARIEADKKLPWQKPFQSACMNWFSKREYLGINRFLLEGGEYLTPNQLEQYNAKEKTTFWFEKGTPYEIVVFYTKYEKKITDAQANEILKQPNGFKLIRLTEKGWVRLAWVLKYYRVYNIKFIRDIVNPEVKENYKNGVYKKRYLEKAKKFVLELDKYGDPIFEDGVTKDDIAKLEPKLGNTVIEEHTPADQIVDKYITPTGVGIKISNDGAYYTHTTDAVYLPPKNYFKSTEAYYRVLFHELTHSTGITERLNRSCFHQYHQGSTERSKEELIAEIGSLLLASEAGFREDTELADNSINYVAGWCSWMRENKAEVLNGMLAAEKAKDFILNGGVVVNSGTERSIDNPTVSDEAGEIESDEPQEAEKSESTNESTDKSTTEKPKSSKNSTEIKSIKTKKAVKEYYETHLARYFAEDITEEEQKELLSSITAQDLKRLYKVFTKEDLPAVSKKAQALTLLRNKIAGASKIG